MRAVITTNASDISDYVSYLPIYHNESYVFFDPKYVSMFVVMDYPVYTVPSSGTFQCNSYLAIIISLTNFAFLS